MSKPAFNRIATIFASFLAVACTVQGASERTQNVITTDTTESLPDIAFSSDPQEALDQLAEYDGAVDQSRISEGPCGLFSLTVGPNGLRGYQWVDAKWVHMDSPFESDFAEPFLITTRDYDYDEVNEFMVNFDENGDGPETSMFGAVLDESNCDWGWVTFKTPTGSSRTVRNLVWDDGEFWFTGSIIYENQEYPVTAGSGTGDKWYVDFM